MMKGIDSERLRISFVVYGGMNRKDWRTISIADVNFDPMNWQGCSFLR
jgi:hypothetical protein